MADAVHQESPPARVVCYLGCQPKDRDGIASCAHTPAEFCVSTTDPSNPLDIAIALTVSGEQLFEPTKL